MKCMLFNATISFAPEIKNWWQAIALSASNYVGGILERMMWGTAIGAAGGIAADGPAPPRRSLRAPPVTLIQVTISRRPDVGFPSSPPASKRFSRSER
ncbi:MAG: hypothetical protein J2P21_27165 [Chloracidobacterium sp.]|nr:hypothetical protein [Chloracidobacterium sp.]